MVEIFFKLHTTSIPIGFLTLTESSGSDDRLPLGYSLPDFQQIWRNFLTSLPLFFSQPGRKGVDTKKKIIVQDFWAKKKIWYYHAIGYLINPQLWATLDGWYSWYGFPPTEKFYSLAKFKIRRQFWRFWKSDYFGRFFASISLVTTPFIVKIKHKHNLLTLYIAVKDKYQEIFE